jgi:vacuolar-type H+-ATPase subunit H
MRAQDMAGGSIDPTLRLLADPDLLNKRIGELETAQKNAQNVIDRVGPIEDLERARAQADEDQKAAQQALDDALEQADAITGEAKNQAELIVEKATQEANKLTEEVASRNEGAKLALNRAENAMATVESEKRALQVRKDELDDVEAVLHQRADELASREQELAGDKSRLAKARDAINAAL